MENDLDIVITPYKNIQKGDFLKTLCNFLELFKSNLKKEKSNLIAFPHSTFQAEVEYLSRRKKEDTFLHINSFPDFYKSVPIQLFSAINKKIYHGEKGSLTEIPITDKDIYYKYLLMANCLYSRYPKELETKKIRHLISYVFEHNKGKIDLKNKTNRQIYFEGCDFVDSIAKTI